MRSIIKFESCNVYSVIKKGLMLSPLVLGGCGGGIIVAVGFNDVDLPPPQVCSTLPTEYSFEESRSDGLQRSYEVSKSWDEAALELTVITSVSDENGASTSVYEYDYASVEDFKDEIDILGLLKFETASETLADQNSSSTKENIFDSEGLLVIQRRDSSIVLGGGAGGSDFSSETIWSSHEALGRPEFGLFESTLLDAGTVVDACERIEVENEYLDSDGELVVRRSGSSDTRCENSGGIYSFEDTITRTTFNEFGHRLKVEFWNESAQGIAPNIDTNPEDVYEFTYTYGDSIEVCL